MAFFSVFLMIIAFVFGGALFFMSSGAVGIILSNEARKNGKKFGKPLMILSSVILAIGFININVPVIVVACAYMSEEGIDGYLESEEVFEYNGITYEKIEIDDLWLLEPEYEESFEYRGEGLSYFLPETYYTIENDHGFNLIFSETDEYYYCADYEKEKVVEYYGDDNNFSWYMYNIEIKNNESKQILAELLEIYKSEQDTITIDMSIQEESEWYDFQQISNDGLFSKSLIAIYEQSGNYYLEMPYEEEVVHLNYYEFEAVEIEKYLAEKLIFAIG